MTFGLWENVPTHYQGIKHPDTMSRVRFPP